MSKGSKPRPRRVSDDAFEEAWFRVFGTQEEYVGSERVKRYDDARPAREIESASQAQDAEEEED